MKTHYALTFAMYWGMTLQKCISAGNTKQSKQAVIMANVDPEDFDSLMLSWAEEFIPSAADDSSEWFDEKLMQFLKEVAV